MRLVSAPCRLQLLHDPSDREEPDAQSLPWMAALGSLPAPRIELKQFSSPVPFALCQCCCLQVQHLWRSFSLPSFSESDAPASS